MKATKFYTKRETKWSADDVMQTCIKHGPKQIGYTYTKEDRTMTYICRTWTRTAGGWTSEIDRFDTEQEAREHGEMCVKFPKFEALETTFEVTVDEDE